MAVGLRFWHGLWDGTVISEMATLTPTELAKLRQALSRGVTVTWDKSTINTVSQAVEDMLSGMSFDPVPHVLEIITTNARSQAVKDALDASQIPTTLIPIVEDWLVENPPSITTRSVNNASLAEFITTNRESFDTAMEGMPPEQREKLIRLVVLPRLEAVV